MSTDATSRDLTLQSNVPTLGPNQFQVGGETLTWGDGAKGPNVSYAANIEKHPDVKKGLQEDLEPYLKANPDLQQGAPLVEVTGVKIDPATKLATSYSYNVNGVPQEVSAAEVDKWNQEHAQAGLAQKQNRDLQITATDLGPASQKPSAVGNDLSHVQFLDDRHPPGTPAAEATAKPAHVTNPTPSNNGQAHPSSGGQHKPNQPDAKVIAEQQEWNKTHADRILVDGIRGDQTKAAEKGPEALAQYQAAHPAMKEAALKQQEHHDNSPKQNAMAAMLAKNGISIAGLHGMINGTAVAVNHDRQATEQPTNGPKPKVADAVDAAKGAADHTDGKAQNTTTPPAAQATLVAATRMQQTGASL